MGNVLKFRRTGLTEMHFRLLAEQLRNVSVWAECADDGSLLAVIDDDNVIALEIGLRDGIFIAARGGQTFAHARRFAEIVLAVSQEIENCT
jgi:hypothetical protein